jgi:hypothetical protein
MKRKFIFIEFFLVTLGVLFGCSTRGELPYGIWESSDPYIVLDVAKTASSMYSGTYEKDGEIINIVFGFNAGFKGLSIFDSSALTGNELQGDSPYFAGTYSYSTNELIYTLNPYWEEIHGFQTIKFKKTQDYLGG